MKTRLIGFLCLFLASSIWGSMYVISKYILGFVSPIMLVWIRYFIACIVLFSVLAIFKKNKENKIKMLKSDWILIAWIGFIGYFVSICFQFIGTKLSNAHMGSLITASTPVFVFVFARFILGENFTKRKIVSLILAVFGVIVVIGFDPTSINHIWGNLILVGAAVTWALLSVYVKVAGEYFDSLTITAYAMLFALVFTTPFMILSHGNFLWILNDRKIFMGIIYLGVVSTAGAFFLWNKGLSLVNTGIGSMFLFFQPISGSILGWIYLKEQLSSSFFIGGILIILGIIVASKD